MQSIEYFFKTFGSAIGPIIAVILIYIKLIADNRFLRKNNKLQIEKIKKLIKKSPLPKWIKTYSESDITLLTEASGCNAYNLGIFERRIITISHLLNEIAKDVYKNLPEKDIDLLANLKYRIDFIVNEITKYRNELEAIGTEHTKNLNDYNKKVKLQIDLPMPQELLDINRELNNKMIFTNIIFMMIGFHYENMLQAIENPLSLQLIDNYKKPD